MNQKQIEAFRMVMRHGTVTGAAKALSVSQPAVSRHIADLEASLGFPLLLRFGGRVEATREAHAFFAEVERMYYGFDRLAQEAQKIRGHQRTTLRLASLPMASFGLIPAAVSAFVARHPGAEVTHDVHTSSRILDQLSARQIDIGLAQTVAARPDVEVVASYTTKCVCVMTRSDPLATRDVITPADLAGRPLVVLNHRTVTYGYVLQRFAEAGVAPDIVAETQPSYSACGLAALGVGIAIVDPVTSGVFGEALTSVAFAPEIPFDFQVLTARDAPFSRAAAAFLEDLTSILDADPRLSRRGAGG
ncbi:LysR substrate-binding domain-containing protein [Roseicyclus sp. F158]|uniref:LysR substrate-binding domain-containing protein n=1 Tax=Tropicimonas omnivorans TaxID=3075590 RepID=A0ABU3DKW3_9RHOB|nr:LysR substrate-binding domain-containing protein [Roseicyclus sp. F158]MDT0684350.1 LysR substrate-binding domain-containing protein [Roseicyclus sp. F158]